MDDLDLLFIRFSHSFYNEQQTLDFGSYQSNTKVRWKTAIIICENKNACLRIFSGNHYDDCSVNMVKGAEYPSYLS